MSEREKDPQRWANDILVRLNRQRSIPDYYPLQITGLLLIAEAICDKLEELDRKITSLNQKEAT